jgi:hypothetical protein
MPRDTVDLIEIPDLSKPSWEGLRYILEHRELWPDHHWFFPEHGTCAIGLAKKVWPEAKGVLGIKDAVKARRVFASGGYPIPDHDVTPKMVADRIGSWLESAYAKMPQLPENDGG